MTPDWEAASPNSRMRMSRELGQLLIKQREAVVSDGSSLAGTWRRLMVEQCGEHGFVAAGGKGRGAVG